MKRTVKLSLGMSFIMLALVLIAPRLASPKLVLRFLPKDVADGIKKERLSFGEAYKRLLAFLLVEKTFDIVCLDQILCMSTHYYQRCYPETRGCGGWKNRAWNSKNQAVRLALYPIFCAVQAYMLTKEKNIVSHV